MYELLRCSKMKNWTFETSSFFLPPRSADAKLLLDLLHGAGDLRVAAPLVRGARAAAPGAGCAGRLAVAAHLLLQKGLKVFARSARFARFASFEDFVLRC